MQGIHYPLLAWVSMCPIYTQFYPMSAAFLKHRPMAYARSLGGFVHVLASDPYLVRGRLGISGNTVSQVSPNRGPDPHLRGSRLLSPLPRHVATLYLTWLEVWMVSSMPGTVLKVLCCNQRVSSSLGFYVPSRSLCLGIHWVTRRFGSYSRDP